ncbi:MAG: DUF120 domain-containing protein [Candidatus Micrarchaeota archaeon]
MDELLLFLLKMGADKQFVNATTSEIGKQLNMSQQNASRKLILLETEKLIERRGSTAKLSVSGMDAIMKDYIELKFLVEGGKRFFAGRVVDGLNEGSYYLSLKGYRDEVKKKLGFEPYAGTINVSLDENEQAKRIYLKQSDPILLSGFSTKERTFGDIFAYPCTLQGVKCAIIIPVRTHHGIDILEVIAPIKMPVRPGDKVKIGLG